MIKRAVIYYRCAHKTNRSIVDQEALCSTFAKQQKQEYINICMVNKACGFDSQKSRQVAEQIRGIEADKILKTKGGIT